jgi:peptide/nickel transport system substrate-binding protein
VPFEDLTIEVQEDRHSSFNALQVGQLDLIYGPAENVAAAEAAGLQVYPHPGTIIAMTILDYQGKVVPELADVRVRQAMNFAIDREAIAENVLPGEPIFQMFPAESEAYVDALDDVYSYDPDKARELLAEAGYGDGLKLSVVVLPNLVPTATAVAGYLDQVGIELEVNSLPVQEFLDKVLSGNASMILTQNTINPTFVDVTALFGVPGGRNPLNNEIPRITELIDEVLYAEPEARADMYAEIATIASEEAISVPVVREIWFFMHNDNVNGLVLPEGYTLPTLRELVP